MKKFLALFLTLSILAFLLSGCGQNQSASEISANQQEQNEKVTIKVGASPVPHAEILEVVKPILEKEGINLEIVEFTDYVQPNLKLAEKELDANYFQHIPYLEEFSKEHNLDLTYIAKVHIEPMGAYSQKIKNLNELKEGATVAIPNDPTNAGRALLLLQTAGLIKLKPEAGIKATVGDIVENPKGLKITELEAATLPRVLPDVDLAVINTNYALEAGLVPTKDALIIEDANSPYVNVLVVRKGDESRPELKKLAEALNSPEVKKFIEEKYQGAVVPAF
ncbi:D-methionine-binding lipoprotein MetQ [Fervidicola ferrireducens]|uniref:Lipoprotein n=1 Tax=Fervidicola ferrireducens TaxID=520764 RepID=A0A140L3U5_9FIRM|nr:MetQ/NlpA family ABC transporter substrate-binding protein [Fervidicola ferrireducens]KXG75220.1 D-methionine-binding lipoprotein MetQ [Fervidicola ferrireducens]